MHILVIPSEEFLPRHDHMAGIFQFHQVQAIREAGHTVNVISIKQSFSIAMILKAVIFKSLTIRINNELSNKRVADLIKLLIDKIYRPWKFITQEVIQGINVLRIDGFYFFPPNKHTNHLGWIYAGRSLWSKYKKQFGKPDIIHAHNAVYAGMLSSEIFSCDQVPYIITEHSSFLVRRLESKYIQRKIKKAYENASMVLPVSETLAQALKNIYGTGFRCLVVPNVLDPFVEQATWFNKISKAADTFVFVSIASLIPLKRQADVIQSFSNSFRGKVNVRLVIGGDGEMKSYLESLIGQLGLKEQVFLSGKLSREEVLSTIDESDCMILSSEIETFGVVLIEALSRGKPLIASKCGGPESIVDSQNGLLYEIGDIEGLSKAMLYIQENIHTYEPRVIREDALLKYGNKPFARKISSVYNSILKLNGETL